MALTGKKYEKFYSTSGSGDDEVTSDNLNKAEGIWDHYRAKGMDLYFDDFKLSPLIYQLQQMQDELDYLRTEITANKSKVTFPGLGTSNSTALAGDTTTISTAQANAITANTAKVSMVIGTGAGEAMSGQTNLVTVGTQAHQAMAGNTKLVGIGSNTTLSFGDLTETLVKGKTTYSIVLQATRDFGGKTGILTKSATITLI